MIGGKTLNISFCIAVNISVADITEPTTCFLVVFKLLIRQKKNLTCKTLPENSPVTEVLQIRLENKTVSVYFLHRVISEIFTVHTSTDR